MNLRFITPDLVEVPEVGRWARVAGGVALTLFGAGLVLVLILSDFAAWAWLMGGVGLCFLLGGLSVATEVKQIRVDRANGVIIKRRGKLAPKHERRIAVTPRAVRLTMNRECHDVSGGNADLAINKLFIVHDKGETFVTSCRFTLDKLRVVAEQLARFLHVEQYEDRLFKILGALAPQTGPGTAPTRTDLDRGITAPVPLEDLHDPFLECEEMRELAEEDAQA